MITAVCLHSTPRSNQHQNYEAKIRVELHIHKIYILPFPRITNDKNLSCLMQFFDTVIFAWNKYKLQCIMTGGIVLSLPICKSRRCRIQFCDFELDVFKSFQMTKRQGQFNQFCNFVIWFRVKSVDPAENNIIVIESEKKRRHCIGRKVTNLNSYLCPSLLWPTPQTIISN